MKRGHLAEQIVLEALADFDPEHQVELALNLQYCLNCEWVSPHDPHQKQVCPRCTEDLANLPLKAHLDIVLPGQRVLEVKTSQLTEIPKAWELQLAMQMFLLSRQTHRHKVDGAILVLDLAKGTMLMKNHYRHCPDQAYNLVWRAIEVWEGVKAASLSDQPEALDLKCEPSPLCGYCSYLGTCPAYQGPELPEELHLLLTTYRKLTEEEKRIKADREKLRDSLLRIIVPGTHQSRNLRVHISQRSKTVADMKAISALLSELGQNIKEFQSTSTYSVLDIKAA